MLNNIKCTSVKCIKSNDILYVQSDIKERKSSNSSTIQSLFALDKNLKLVSPYLKVNKVMVPIEQYASDKKEMVSSLLSSGEPIFYKYDSFVYLVFVDYVIKDKKMINKSIKLNVPVDIDDDASKLTVFAVNSQFEDKILKLLNKFCRTLVLTRSNKVVRTRV